MLQPFIPFKLVYLERFQNNGTNYFVTQSYHRAYDHFADHAKTDLLVSEYEDRTQAITHFNAVKADKYAAIIDISKPAHLDKFKQMLSPESNYRVFWTVLEEKETIEKRMNEKYKEQLRKYLNEQTTWKITGDEKIKPQLEVIFGELFITIKRGAHKLRVKLDEIERS
jgi:lipoprotein NlpI